MRFWNQTIEEELESKKGQNPEQEAREIRRLLDENDDAKPIPPQALEQFL
jgi:hypothetical protein